MKRDINTVMPDNSLDKMRRTWSRRLLVGVYGAVGRMRVELQAAGGVPLATVMPDLAVNRIRSEVCRLFKRDGLDWCGCATPPHSWPQRSSAGARARRRVPTSYKVVNQNGYSLHELFLS